MRLSSYPVSRRRSYYPVLQYILCLSDHCLNFSYSGSPDHQIHLYTVPSLDPFPSKPIRHVVTFAVDDQHLRRPPPSFSPQGVRPPLEPVDFCIIKRNG